MSHGLQGSVIDSSDTDESHVSPIQDLFERAATAVAEIGTQTTESVRLKRLLDEIVVWAHGAREEIEGRRADSEKLLAELAGLRAAAQVEQEAIAARSANVHAAEAHAIEMRANLDSINPRAAQQLVEAEGGRAKIESSVAAANTLLAEIRVIRGAIDADAVTASESKAAALSSMEAAKSLGETAEQVQGKIAAYEAELGRLTESAREKLAEIDRLLPGATAAGLAHAFDDRRIAFRSPILVWQGVFVVCILVLGAVASVGLWHTIVGGSSLSYDEVLRHWLARIPIAAAVAWLAVHASREAGMAKRLEEDYGYKTAIATSFLGFNKQMAEIAKATAADSPLAKLCNDTLDTLASPPGRIYDKYKLVVTPFDNAKTFVEALKAAAPNAKA